MNKAVFIDKDGTLLQDVPYNVDPTLIQFQAGALNSLRRLKDEGYLLIIVSNQSGVARGFFDEAALEGVKDHIYDALWRVGIQLDGFYICPHHPCGVVDRYAFDCHCRKPKPGMLQQAASDFKVELSSSWMIGDILHDVEAGNRAGCRTILLNSGNETEWINGPYRTADYTVSSWPEATEIIVSTKVYCLQDES